MSRADGSLRGIARGPDSAGEADSSLAALTPSLSRLNREYALSAARTRSPSERCSLASGMSVLSEDGPIPIEHLADGALFGVRRAIRIPGSRRRAEAE
jgi:hypothetical protein